MGKTLNTEVQEEGLQIDKNRCFLTESSTPNHLHLKRRFQQCQENVTQPGCEKRFNYQEKDAYYPLHLLNTSVLTLVNLTFSTQDGARGSSQLPMRLPVPIEVRSWGIGSIHQIQQGKDGLTATQAAERTEYTGQNLQAQPPQGPQPGPPLPASFDKELWVPASSTSGDIVE